LTQGLLGQGGAGLGLEVDLDGVVLDLAIAAEQDAHHLERRRGGHGRRRGRLLLGGGRVGRAAGRRVGGPRDAGRRSRQQHDDQRTDDGGRPAEAGSGNADHDLAYPSSSTITPSTMRSLRGVWAASSLLWV